MKCKGECKCIKCELKRYIKKTIQEEMIVPKDGVDGYTPQKDIDYFDGKNGEQGIEGKQGIPGINGKLPDVYHFTISQSVLGNKINLGNNIYYSIAKDGTTGLINVRLQGTQDLSGDTIVDVNWSMNRGGTIVNASHENLLIDNMYYILTTGIKSMDLHKTTIRSKNARTGLWEMYEVNMLPSVNNTRIDVWVYEIYKDFVGEWK